MAKKRLTPAVNPLKKDLIAALARPPEISEVLPQQPIEIEGTRSADAGAGKKRPVPKPTYKASAPPSASRLEPKKAVQRTLFSVREAEENVMVTMTLRKVFGSKVTESDITRAFWELLRRHDEDFKALVPKFEKVSRPALSDKIGLTEYEDKLVNLFLRVFKRAAIEDETR